MDEKKETPVYQAILDQYLNRVQVKPGTGLSKCMNASLRSYPDIPNIIERVIAWLYHAEQVTGFGGIYIRPHRLYWDLVRKHDDWGYDSPKFGEPLLASPYLTVEQLIESTEDPHRDSEGLMMSRTLTFDRIALLPYQRFQAATTIARHIRLLAGHGRVGLSIEFAKAIRKISVA